MAQVIRVRWFERNKQFIANLKKLQGLYDHDAAVFQFNDILDDKPTKQQVIDRLEAGGLGNGKRTKKQQAAEINSIDAVEMAIEMPFSAEEFSLNLESSFQSIEEMLPSSIQKGANFINLMGKAGGALNAGFTNLFGFQVWDKTAPVELNLEFAFNTVKSGWLDVWAPMASLCGQSILSIDVRATVNEEKTGLTFTEANTYRTPGVSLPNLGFFQRAKARQDKAGKEGATQSSNKGEDKNLPIDPDNPPANTKVVSIEIPGLIFLETALIKSAKPTFSKEITESGAPLWGKLDLSIQSVVPANDNLIFSSAFRQIAKLKKKTVADKLEGFIKNAF